MQDRGAGDDMLFAFLAQVYLDFGIEIRQVLRVAADEIKELVEIVFMGFVLITLGSKTGTIIQVALTP